MTPLEFVQLKEEDLRTLLEDTSKKLGIIDLKEIIKSIVPIVEVNNMGAVFKKKLKVHFVGRGAVVCFYLHYVIYINLTVAGENTVTGKYVVEIVVNRYLMEGKEQYIKLQ